MKFKSLLIGISIAAAALAAGCNARSDQKTQPPAAAEVEVVQEVPVETPFDEEQAEATLDKEALEEALANILNLDKE
jgi:apolipoprotein N-acyltransferase